MVKSWEGSRTSAKYLESLGGRKIASSASGRGRTEEHRFQ